MSLAERKNQVDEQARRQKERSESYLWNGIRTGDLANKTTSFVTRPLTSQTKFFPFDYPSYSEKEGQGREINGIIHLSGNSRWDNYRAGSPIEDAMVKLHQMALQRYKEYRIRLAKEPLSEEKVKRLKLDFWGAKPEEYGFTWLCNGKTVQQPVSMVTFDPELAEKIGKKYNRKRDLEAGIKDYLCNNLSNLGKILPAGSFGSDKCYFTPFVSQFVLTAVEAKNKSGKDAYLVWEPKALIPKGWENRLPVEFADCLWLHPEDSGKVTSFLDELIDLEARKMESSHLATPDYRNYPNDSGELLFVSKYHKSTDLDPIRINIFEGVLAEYFNAEIMETIKNQPKSSWYKPSTQLSLLGGFYYVNTSEDWITLTQQQIKGYHNGNFTDREPELVIDGKTFIAKYNDGALNRKPLNPWRLDSDNDYIYGDSALVDWIAKQAQAFGIPLKGEVSIPTDPFSFLDQKPQVSIGSKTADLL